MIPIVTTEEMRHLEQESVALGVSLDALMDNAGLAVARTAHAAAQGQPGTALALIGPGNNGGDGLVSAAHLVDWGWRVFLHSTSSKPRDPNRFPILRAVQPSALPTEPVDLVLDALLGTGSSRPLAGEIAAVLDAVRSSQSSATVVAVDVPSGVNSDTGAADPRTLKADITVTLGVAKAGLFQYPARQLAGTVRVTDIGIPASLTGTGRSWVSSADLVRPFLPPRPQDAHKGTFGKLLILAGSVSFTGAPYLTAMSAMRMGAGLVRLAVPRSVHQIIAGKVTEATFTPLPETEGGAVSLRALPAIQQLLGEDYDCLLLGPGLGQDDETREVIQRVLLGGEKLPPRVVIDADGLNALARDLSWSERLPPGCVLTPHPAEFGRISGLPLQDILANRFALAGEKARQWRQIIVAKGANGIVAGPDGRRVIDPGANPLIATAGTGDVLAGAIAGLLTQGAKPWEGAAAATYVSSLAAKRLIGRFGCAGLIASDLHDQLPLALKALRDRGSMSLDRVTMNG